MKKFSPALLIMFLLMTGTLIFAQQKTNIEKGFINGVDTRVDNMRYWLDKAEKGLIPYNASIPVKSEIPLQQTSNLVIASASALEIRLSPLVSSPSSRSAFKKRVSGMFTIES